MVFGDASAENATITTRNGGQTLFFFRATGGNAEFITEAGGVVDFSGSTGPDNDGRITAGSIEGAGTYYIGPGNTLVVGSNNLTREVSGVIVDAPCGCPGIGTLEKVGTGTLILSSINTYSGGTTFRAGTVSVSQEANLGDIAGALNFNGGILQITGTSFTSTTRAINWMPGGGGFDIANAANTFTVAQTLGGVGALSKLGAGTLVLSGNNTYQGGTTISAGTLRIMSDQSVGTGAVAINGGVLQSGAHATAGEQHPSGRAGRHHRHASVRPHDVGSLQRLPAL